MRGLCCFGTLILKTHYNSSSLKEIMTVFGRVILVNNFFYDFMCLSFPYSCSFSFDWEDISNTQGSVWPHFQTPRFSSKILRCTSYFKLSSRCLAEIWSSTVFCVWKCLWFYFVKQQYVNPADKYLDQIRDWLWTDLTRECFIFICKQWSENNQISLNVINCR